MSQYIEKILSIESRSSLELEIAFARVFAVQKSTPWKNNADSIQSIELERIKADVRFQQAFSIASSTEGSLVEFYAARASETLRLVTDSLHKTPNGDKFDTLKLFVSLVPPSLSPPPTTVVGSDDGCNQNNQNNDDDDDDEIVNDLLADFLSSSARVAFQDQTHMFSLVNDIYSIEQFTIEELKSLERRLDFKEGEEEEEEEEEEEDDDDEEEEEEEDDDEEDEEEEEDDDDDDKDDDEDQEDEEDQDNNNKKMPVKIDAKTARRLVVVSRLPWFAHQLCPVEDVDSLGEQRGATPTVKDSFLALFRHRRSPAAAAAHRYIALCNELCLWASLLRVRALPLMLANSRKDWKAALPVVYEKCVPAVTVNRLHSLASDFTRTWDAVWPRLRQVASEIGSFVRRGDANDGRVSDNSSSLSTAAAAAISSIAPAPLADDDPQAVISIADWNGCICNVASLIHRMLRDTIVEFVRFNAFVSGCGATYVSEIGKLLQLSASDEASDESEVVETMIETLWSFVSDRGLLQPLASQSTFRLLVNLFEVAFGAGNRRCSLLALNVVFAMQTSAARHSLADATESADSKWKLPTGDSLNRLFALLPLLFARGAMVAPELWMLRSREASLIEYVLHRSYTVQPVAQLLQHNKYHVANNKNNKNKNNNNNDDDDDDDDDIDEEVKD